MASVRYELSIRRAAVALLVGAPVGTLMLIALWMLDLCLWPRTGMPADTHWMHSLSDHLLIDPIYFAAYSLGLLLAGIPVWVLAHRTGWRGWRTAIVVGFVLTAGLNLAALPLPFVGYYGASDDGGAIVFNGRMTLHLWLEFIQMAVILGAGGILVGWIVWRIAYRKPVSSESQARAFD